MGEIKEPGPIPYTVTDPAIKYLREMAHVSANRSTETQRCLIETVEKIETDAAVSPVTGFEEASENLDKYIYW